MAYIQLSENGTSPFEKLMGYSPTILQQWQNLEAAFFSSKTFDADFLEQIRRALAFNNLCQYCMNKAGAPEQNPKTIRLQEALSFANRFAIDHTSLTQDDIKHMLEVFSESELSELISYCSFITACQKFGATLGLQAANHYK